MIAFVLLYSVFWIVVGFLLIKINVKPFWNAVNSGNEKKAIKTSIFIFIGLIHIIMFGIWFVVDLINFLS